MESPLQMALNIQPADEALRNDNDLASLSLVFRGHEIFQNNQHYATGFQKCSGCFVYPEHNRLDSVPLRLANTNFSFS